MARETTMLLLMPETASDAGYYGYLLTQAGFDIGNRINGTMTRDEDLERFASALYPGDHLAKVRRETIAKVRDKPLVLWIVHREDAIARLDALVGESDIPVPGEKRTWRDIEGPDALHCPKNAGDFARWRAWLNAPK